MTSRNAIRNSPVLAGVLLLAALWVLLTLMNVFNARGPLNGEWVGANGVAGLVGVVVLAIILGLAVVVFADLGESEPQPEAFPPQE